VTDGEPSVAEQLAAVSTDAWDHIAVTLTRLTGDRELAEDCVQDAFARALVRWPVDGVPGKPMAWLMTTARNRAMDRARRAAWRLPRRRRATPRGRESASFRVDQFQHHGVVVLAVAGGLGGL